MDPSEKLSYTSKRTMEVASDPSFLFIKKNDIQKKKSSDTKLKEEIEKNGKKSDSGLKGHSKRIDNVDKKIKSLNERPKQSEKTDETGNKTFRINSDTLSKLDNNSLPPGIRKVEPEKKGLMSLLNNPSLSEDQSKTLLNRITSYDYRESADKTKKKVKDLFNFKNPT